MQLGRKLAREFHERPAVIRPVAVEKPVQPHLKPVEQRLEQNRRQDDGQYPHAVAGGPNVVAKQVGAERHQAKIQAHHRRRRQRIRHPAPEDDVHIHEAVTHDRVAKRQRQERQRED